ncbi:MAG TPA: sulfatase-like hydrolase/transferase, partial [Bacillota bacterium]|nr:sulfatase-like hydrolase/transferase [Bacillota bacterium]
KYSIFEGGTRIPLIVRWPGQVQPGVSDALVSQVDFAASFAALTGQSLGPEDVPDSLNVLTALLGESKTGREYIVEQASRLALRQGDWKYISPGKGPKRAANTNTELGNDSAPQLYNLTQDPGEKQNLASSHPELVQKLSKLLEQVQERSPSRPAVRAD